MDLAIRFLRTFTDGWEPKQPSGHYCEISAKNGTVLERHWEQGTSVERCDRCGSTAALKQHDAERKSDGA